jgi:hypothetical protein
MTAQALAAIDLKPDELAGFLVGQLRTAPTFFGLDDMRTSLVPKS